jgi:hypothetical protein
VAKLFGGEGMNWSNILNINCCQFLGDPGMQPISTYERQGKIVL